MKGYFAIAALLLMLVGLSPRTQAFSLSPPGFGGCTYTSHRGCQILSRRGASARTHDVRESQIRRPTHVRAGGRGKYVRAVESAEKVDNGLGANRFDVEGVPGLQITAKPSFIGLGLGMFLSVKEANVGKTIFLKEGTRLCTYCDVSQGQFRSQSSGDKTAQYSFTDLDQLICYGEKQVPLIQALAHIPLLPTGAEMRTRSSDRLVEGHRVFFNEDNKLIRIEPVGELRNFVPGTTEGVAQRAFLGTLANDLAYSDQCNESEYEQHCNRNILARRWVMAVRDGKLVPKSVALVSGSDVEISNVDPQEVGLSYGWKYWQGTRYSVTRNKMASAIALAYGMAGLAYAADQLGVF